MNVALCTFLCAQRHIHTQASWQPQRALPASRLRSHADPSPEPQTPQVETDGCDSLLDLLAGKGQAQMIPGWPYSMVAALEPGPDVVDAAAGRRAAGPGGRRDRGDRSPGPRCRRPTDRDRALAGR
jgi:hypothetical protein